jgi:hypothetical protein
VQRRRGLLCRSDLPGLWWLGHSIARCSISSTRLSSVAGPMRASAQCRSSAAWSVGFSGGSRTIAARSVAGEHAMKDDQMQAWIRHQCGESLHETQRRYPDVGSAVLVRARQRQKSTSPAAIDTGTY